MVEIQNKARVHRVTTHRIHLHDIQMACQGQQSIELGHVLCLGTSFWDPARKLGCWVPCLHSCERRRRYRVELRGRLKCFLANDARADSNAKGLDLTPPALLLKQCACQARQFVGRLVPYIAITEGSRSRSRGSLLGGRGAQLEVFRLEICYSPQCELFAINVECCGVKVTNTMFGLECIGLCSCKCMQWMMLFMNYEHVVTSSEQTTIYAEQLTLNLKALLFKCT